MARGDSERHVLELRGKPNSVSGAPENIAWGDDASIQTNNGVCVRVLWYSPPINIDGEAWAIGLDRGGKVASKYHYESP